MAFNHGPDFEVDPFWNAYTEFSREFGDGRFEFRPVWREGIGKNVRLRTRRVDCLVLSDVLCKQVANNLGFCVRTGLKKLETLFLILCVICSATNTVSYAGAERTVVTVLSILGDGT